MQNNLNVSTAPKTAVFQMSINPEIKKQVEKIYENCGMTLTEAINTFLQQSINAEGLPFVITQNTKEALKAQAASRLFEELKKGFDSANKDGWIDEADMLKEFGAWL